MQEMGVPVLSRFFPGSLVLRTSPGFSPGFGPGFGYFREMGVPVFPGFGPGFVRFCVHTVPWEVLAAPQALLRSLKILVFLQCSI